MEKLDHILDTFSNERPILLVDADEVLLKFIEHLEYYFSTQGYELRLDTFHLVGNVYKQSEETPAAGSIVKDLLAGFFDTQVSNIPAVDHAANALKSLSDEYQIAVLTNVPHHCRERREESLRSHGFHYPVISNDGGKGPAVKHLQNSLQTPMVFVDDLPPQISSVAQHAPDTHLVHFVADPRLAKLINKAPEAHVRIDDWIELQTYLQCHAAKY